MNRLHSRIVAPAAGCRAGCLHLIPVVWLVLAAAPAEAAIQTLGQYNTSGSSYGSAVSSDNSTLFVADWSQTLQIIDVSDPANPALLTTYDTAGEAAAVVISASGNEAFVACGGQGLLIIDISNPASPSPLGQYNTSGSALGLALSADEAKVYLADGTQGLLIVDVSNPASPSLLGQYNTNGTSYDVALSPDESIACVADDLQGLKIIDVSNPASPSEVGAYNTNGNAVAVCLSSDGNQAYVADMGQGLKVIDVSNPASPSQLGSYKQTGSFKVYGVTLSATGTRVFLAYGKKGISVVDIIDPGNPSLLEEFDPAGSGAVLSRHISISNNGGSVAFNSHSGDGVFILDISDYAAVANEAEWNFEDGSGQTATDSTGNGHHGTLGSTGHNDSNDPDWVSGRCGGTALDFDGNDYVDIGNTMSHLANFTVTAWVKPAVIATDKQIISKGYDGTNIQWELKTTSTGGRVSFRAWTDGVGAKGVESVQTLSADRWTHLAGTYDGSEWRIYFNGSLDNTATAAGPTATIQRILIGAVDSGGTAIQFWQGVIDEVYIFDRVLSEAEILALVPCGMSIVKWREVIK